MANYRNIHGINIETVSSNPDNPANGQVWYNSTDQKLRGNAQTTAGAWASGGNLNTTKARHAASGTQTAALAFGGENVTATNESYNGTAFTEESDLNTARRLLAGTGIQTATLAFGGENPGTTDFDITESWNGSSWTEVGDLNTARNLTGGSGLYTSALGAGGFNQGGGASEAKTESWNGTSWTEVGDLNQARSSNM